MRLNINLDDKLLADVTDYADKLHINRTAAISVLLSQALSSNAGVAALTELNRLLQDQQQRDAFSCFDPARSGADPTASLPKQD